VSATPGVTVRHHREDVSVSREDSLDSKMSTPQLLKRKWSEDMTRTRADAWLRDTRKSAKAVVKPKRAIKARGEFPPSSCESCESGHLLGGLKLRK
jgi:hypothetical protein